MVGMCRTIISLSKIIHQMWRDHPFGQRNKTTKRVGEFIGVYVYVCGWAGGERGVSKFEKERIGNIG